MWPELSSKINNRHGQGLFEHREIVLGKSNLDQPLACCLHNHLIRFLCNMNPSFSLTYANYCNHDIKAQRNALFRLAKRIEDSLDGIERSTVDHVGEVLASLRLSA